MHRTNIIVFKIKLHVELKLVSPCQIVEDRKYIVKNLR